ncbi:MAG: Lrp/AsnC family transcriptional regulator [Deltaproteobacteria bacterium]|nr:Lrp/AsnC family transcriptional regulator [Deltaproteobacteria bacterium]
MDAKNIELIKVLQREEIYLEESPFNKAAEHLGWRVEEVLERSRALVSSGVIRRFGAALTPARAGYSENAMVVWHVQADKAEEVGCIMARHPQVSHCYIRSPFEGFPYTLYTMIHADSARTLEGLIRELSEGADLRDYRVLRTVREFKKSSPVYFP